ncbi:MAG TPA: plastocyanin/azurin family copper-binding protein [Ktedonobacterales bacterium]
MKPRSAHGWASLLTAIGAIVALALLVAGCGGSTAAGTTPPTATTGSSTSAPPTATTGSSGSGSGGATIAMGSGHFSGNTSVTIKAGESVVFDDSSGGPHDLVIGTHGASSPEAGAPSQLNTSSGINFGGGDKQTVAFPTAGTYNITCTLHPSMQATVTVTP